ncbi:MAG: hypothetical protein FWD90_09815 [Defluviitaleaceae bacterium]|nr:hypothetical protein [Defluviitaleaceae bacterium]
MKPDKMKVIVFVFVLLFSLSLAACGNVVDNVINNTADRINDAINDSIGDADTGDNTQANDPQPSENDTSGTSDDNTTDDDNTNDDTDSTQATSDDDDITNSDDTNSDDTNGDDTSNGDTNGYDDDNYFMYGTEPVEINLMELLGEWVGYSSLRPEGGEAIDLPTDLRIYYENGQIMFFREAMYQGQKMSVLSVLTVTPEGTIHRDAGVWVDKVDGINLIPGELIYDGTNLISPATDEIRYTRKICDECGQTIKTQAAYGGNHSTDGIQPVEINLIELLGEWVGYSSLRPEGGEAIDLPTNLLIYYENNQIMFFRETMHQGQKMSVLSVLTVTPEGTIHRDAGVWVDKVDGVNLIPGELIYDGTNLISPTTGEIRYTRKTCNECGQPIT